jgi:hypothetical protein
MKIGRGSFGQHGVAHVYDQFQDPLVDRISVRGGFSEFLLRGALGSLIEAGEGDLDE